MQQDNVKRIKSLRNKLHKSIKKYGVNAEETYDNIQRISYPATSEMKLYYEYSYKQLKIVTQQLERFPSVQEWNKFAKENVLLSSMSMQYISKLNWNYLRTKILRELNMNI